MKIAFIGLGNMGSPMARNLLKAGHGLTVFDLNKAALAELVGAGAVAAASPAAAVAGAETVITMLPMAAHVNTVLFAEDGVFAGLGAGVPIIDSSTIDPQSAQAFAKATAERGSAFVDAPVSGGTAGAAAGTLTFMVGATPEVCEQVRPVLEAMGKNIIHCGASGTGQIAKICNNLLLGIAMAGVAEAMSLGEKLGIDVKTLASIINTSTGRCWSADTNNPMPGVLPGAPSSRGYTGGFGTDLMLKDMTLATQAAHQVKQPVMMGALAQQLYRLSSQHGEGAHDFSSIIKLYRADEA
jgi:3-hydroxyisobutyrate dehydrogenase